MGRKLNAHVVVNMFNLCFKIYFKYLLSIFQKYFKMVCLFQNVYCVSQAIFWLAVNGPNVCPVWSAASSPAHGQGVHLEYPTWQRKAKLMVLLQVGLGGWVGVDGKKEDTSGEKWLFHRPTPEWSVALRGNKVVCCGLCSFHHSVG